jgi:hypothetical protein
LWWHCGFGWWKGWICTKGLEGRNFAKFPHWKGFGGDMSCKSSKFRWFSSAFVLQKFSLQNGFLEKPIGQECPAKVRFRKKVGEEMGFAKGKSFNANLKMLESKGV